MNMNNIIERHAHNKIRHTTGQIQNLAPFRPVAMCLYPMTVKPLPLFAGFMCLDHGCYSTPRLTRSGHYKNFRHDSKGAVLFPCFSNSYYRHAKIVSHAPLEQAMESRHALHGIPLMEILPDTIVAYIPDHPHLFCE